MSLDDLLITTFGKVNLTYLGGLPTTKLTLHLYGAYVSPPGMVGGKTFLIAATNARGAETIPLEKMRWLAIYLRRYKTMKEVYAQFPVQWRLIENNTPQTYTIPQKPGIWITLSNSVNTHVAEYTYPGYTVRLEDFDVTSSYRSSPFANKYELDLLLGFDVVNVTVVKKL